MGAGMISARSTAALAVRQPRLRLSRHVALQAGGFAVSSGIASLAAAVTTALVARSLDKSGFGSFSFCVSLLTLAALFFEFGLFIPAARRAAAAEGEERRRVVGAALALFVPIATLFGLTVFALSFFVDSWFNVDAAGALRVAAALAFVYPFRTLATCVAQGTDRLHVFSVASLVGQLLCAAALALVLVFLGGHLSVARALLLQTGALLVGWALLVFWLGPRFDGLGVRVRQLLNDARHYGLQVYVGRVLSIGTSNMDVLLIGIWASATDVGQYALAVAVTTTSGLPVAGLSTALFPRMVNKSRIDMQWLGLAAGVGAACAAVVWILGRPFIELVFGARYAPAAAYILPLALAQLVRGVTGIFNSFLWARGEGKSLRNAGLVLAGSNVALDLALIPHYGAAGAAWASLLALLANLAAHIAGYRRTSSPEVALA